MNPSEHAWQTMQRGSLSFTLASRLFAPRVRDDVALLYHWLRACDDAVDEAPAGLAPARAAELEQRLDDVLCGKPPQTLEDAALARVLASHAIAPLYLREFLEGMAGDARGQQMSTVRQLDEYCYRVAGTVGLMMCQVLGVTSAAALQHAAHMGMAMQLTNICRDVVEDWQRGRLYLPHDLLERHGGGHLTTRVGQPLSDEDARIMDRCCAELWARAERGYRSGDHGVPMLPWRASLAVAAARAIYSAIGAALQRRGFAVLRGRVVIGAWTKLGLLAGAVVRRTLALVQRRVPALEARGQPLVFADVRELS